MGLDTIYKKMLTKVVLKEPHPSYMIYSIKILSYCYVYFYHFYSLWCHPAPTLQLPSRIHGSV